MADLFDIHDIAIERIKKRVSLEPVDLKYPFPVRPPRMLGLMKIDGEVFSSDKMSRTVFLKVGFPFYFTVHAHDPDLMIRQRAVCGVLGEAIARLHLLRAFTARVR